MLHCSINLWAWLDLFEHLPRQAGATVVIDRFDHVVLTVADVGATLDFYERVLGMRRFLEPERPPALLLGGQKIHVHQAGRSFLPAAVRPTAGAGDLCLVTSWPVEAVLERLAAERVPVELGPVERQGALGPMISVYFRDPDGNLLEVSRYP
jgi:catechol 2,3-dioxygenase-like lactoylglutathione lyase family enzyme